jgi:hypothetical protein
LASSNLVLAVAIFEVLQVSVLIRLIPSFYFLIN